MIKNSILPSYIALVAAAFLYGFLVFGAKILSMHGFSLIEILIYPNLIVAVLVGIFTKPEYKKFFNTTWKVGILYLISVISVQFGQYGPLFFGLSVSLTVFLLYMQPLWTTLISVFFLGEKFKPRDGILICIMLIGLVFLISPWEEFKFSAVGFVLAIIGGMGMAGWVTINGTFNSKRVKPVTTIFYTNIYQSIPFIMMYPLFAKFLPSAEISGINFDRGIEALAFLVIYSIVIYIGASALFYTAAKKVKNVHLGLVLLLEPVVATILDVVFLNTVITWNIFVGGALILAANAYLILMSRAKNS
ncbi:MAG: DMT family transporter [Lactobacillus sp.]|jgi:drug/metabolite transporter (DMT)-like permease|nr:DMT family transporter [Lactobacillus sp.]